MDTVDAAGAAQTPSTVLKNLSEVLSSKKYDSLSTEEQAQYDQAFEAFRQEFRKKFPEGKKIKVGIKAVSILPNAEGLYVIQLKEGPDTSTTLLRMSRKQLDILFENALSINGPLAATTLVSCLNKGALEMTVMVVNEDDEYLDKDGNVAGHYTKKQVAILGNPSYVPSAEVMQEMKSVLVQIQKVQVAAMFAAPTNAPANAPAPATVVEEDEDGMTI